MARRIEELAATDTGRGSARLAVPVRGDLLAAAKSLATATSEARIAVVTGFHIPRAVPPAAETDGPLGACLLACALARLGASVCVVTDEPCMPVVRGTLDEAIRAARFSTGAPTLRLWPVQGHSAMPTHVISVERVGRTADGTYRNMLGDSIGDRTAPLDVWFTSQPGVKIAIGDGGNEIGMGKLPPSLVADVVKNGSKIHCTVPSDHLVLGGTSNWGAHGLASMLDRICGGLDKLLSEAWSLRVLRASVESGAVDGVTATRQLSVDGLDWTEYWQVPNEIGRLR